MGINEGAVDVAMRQAQNELRISNERLSLVVTAADLGIWDWNVVADTAYLSPEYLRLVGEAESEIRSARAWYNRLIHPDDRERVIGRLDECLQGKIPQFIVEFRARRSSGEYIWVREIGKVATRDQTGAPLRMLGVIQDISEQKHLEEQLRQAIEVRDNVLAIASHDLKNPLSAIQLTAALLTERPRDQERRKSRTQLDLILRSAVHMRRFIDDVLDAATIEAGTFALNYAREEPKSLLDDLFHEFEPLAARKSIHLVWDVRSDLPPIWCDPIRLRQVLSNLIGNAIKFVRANGTIRVRAWANGGDVHFEVADSGPGIGEEMLLHLFDRFSTADRATVRGAGLGLFISKGIVEAHHGEIFVDSKVGVGTTFHFAIPVDERRRRGEEMD